MSAAARTAVIVPFPNAAPFVEKTTPGIPPHVTLKEATAYAKSVLKGDPDAKHMIGETIKTAVAGVFKKDGEKGE